MTFEPMLLEPELESLLREVAADPDSSLLRVPRAKALPTLYEDLPAAGPATAGLSAAEREILRVHRLEVAWLLRQVCVWNLVEGGRTRQFVGRYLNPRRCVEMPNPHTIDVRRETLAVALDDNDACTLALTLLAHAAADPLGEAPTVLQLASAAHRLNPSHSARVLASQGLVFSGSARAALALLHAVQSFYPSGSVGVSAMHTCGLAHLVLGALRRAHAAYREASNADDERPSVWMDRMALAIQVGDASDAITAADHLEDLMTADHEEVVWFVDSRTQRRRSGEWQPTQEATRLIPDLTGQLGSVGWRITNAFT